MSLSVTPERFQRQFGFIVSDYKELIHLKFISTLLKSSLAGQRKVPKIQYKPANMMRRDGCALICGYKDFLKIRESTT